jgi:ATP-binding cassette subfamily B protein
MLNSAKNSKFLFLLRYFVRYKYYYVLGVFCIFLTNYSIASIPLYIKELVDLIEQKTPAKDSLFFQAILISFFLVVFAAVVRTLSRIFFFNTARKVEFEIKNQLFTKVTKFPRAYFIGNQAGKIISQINNDTLWIRLLCGFGVMQITNVFFSFSIIPYKMWQLSPKITLFSILFLFLIFSFVYTGVIHSMKFYLRRMGALQSISNSILSTLNGLEVIRTFDMQYWCKKQFQQENHILYSNAIKASFWRSLFTPLLNNVEVLLKILIFYLGAQLFFQGDFSIGEITAMISYIAFLTPPLISMGWLLNVLLQARLGLNSIFDILEKKDAYQEITSQKQEQVKKQMEKGIFVKNLSFSYSDGEEQEVLKRIHFSIPKGKIIGILGSIGSGKTTICRLLNKYLDAPRDSVFFGDLDICDIDHKILRKLVRTVNQDAFLFSDSIANNILFGADEKKEFTKDEWQEIFQKSALSEEMKIFSQGKETLVGEKGIMLSGGQKQRISFARSMMKDCQLLVLDNIMSALDYETEDILLNQIMSKEHAASILIISHRVRVLSRVDEIFVLEDGKIVESGSYEQLMKNKNYFYRTWKIQNE